MGTFHQVNTGGPLFSGIQVPPRDGHFNQAGREVRASVFHVRSPSPRVEDKRAAIMHGGKTLQTRLKQNKIHTTPRWERQSQRPSLSIIDSSCFISSPDRNIGCSSFYGDMKNKLRLPGQEWWACTSPPTAPQLAGIMPTGNGG